MRIEANIDNAFEQPLQDIVAKYVDISRVPAEKAVSTINNALNLVVYDAMRRLMLKEGILQLSLDSEADNSNIPVSFAYNPEKVEDYVAGLRSRYAELVADLQNQN